jgi:sulfur carrier protein ThiS
MIESLGLGEDQKRSQTQQRITRRASVLSWLTLMKVKIHILPREKDAKVLVLPEGATVETVVRKLGLYPDAWIAVRGDTPVPLDDVLREGDEVKLIAVVSGG